MTAKRAAAPSTHHGSGLLRTAGRLLLGAALAGAGIGHLTTLREEFQAQVPPWLPLDPDFVVVASGVVEVGLGAALVLAPQRLRPAVGWTTAAFFVAIFPGNISQYVTGTDAFGLTSDNARLVEEGIAGAEHDQMRQASQRPAVDGRAALRRTGQPTVTATSRSA